MVRHRTVVDEPCSSIFVRSADGSCVLSGTARDDRLGAQFGNVFVGVQSFFYWSATEIGTNAWFVFLSDGSVSFSVKFDNYYVWPVRVGQ